VKTGDGLVAELMQSLAQGFSEHKGRLESAWQSGEKPGHRGVAPGPAALPVLLQPAAVHVSSTTAERRSLR
jgi:hypothetical protein